MRLVDGKHYRIEGTFIKRAYQPHHTLFEGCVTVGPGRLIKGVMVDENGASTIRGTVGMSVDWVTPLEFTKKYDRTYKPLYRGGSKFPVLCTLSSTDSGGWTGDWKIPQSGDPEDHGLLTLALVDWDDTYPINPDLMEYLELIRVTRALDG